ncbi:MAG: cyclic nucleotide-binding domain-containing protein [Rhodospirillales bacterium]
MSIEGLDRILGEHDFFKGLAPEFLSLLAGCASNAVFKDGEFLYREGEDAQDFFLVRAGDVGLELATPAGGAIVIETLHEGDVLGWSWLVPPHRSRFDARARGPVRCTRLDGACLRGKMETDHELGYQVYRRFLPILADRLGAARLQMLDLYGGS